MYREIKQNITLCLVLLTLLAFPAHSSVSDTLSLASRFSRLDINDGLSQATVTALVQDHDGYIWIGTQNGLNRYDGFNVKAFRPEDKYRHTLADNFVSALVVDDLGAVWIGTLKGLNRYNPKRGVFERIKSTSALTDGDEAILSLHIDRQTRLWAGTERGIALWHSEQNQLLPWPENMATLAALQQHNINAIVSDANDNLWLGTPHGLKCVNISSGAITDNAQFPYPQASVMALFYDKDGRLWVGLENEGLLMRDTNASSWTHIPLATYENGVTSKEIRSITMDHLGAVWVGTQHGLNQLTLQQGRWKNTASYYHQRHNASSLGSGKVVTIMEGRDKSIWVGTWNGGVSRLHQANNLFTSITPDLSFMAQARNPATITLASRDATIWAGTADGLFELSLAKASLNTVGDSQESLTFYSAVTLDKNILFGHTSGIKRLNTANQQYQNLPLPAAVPDGPVRRMHATADQLWLAIEQFGIVIVDRALQQVLTQQPFSRSITFIQPAPPNYMLVGSYTGLSWFDAKTGDLLFSHPLSSAEVPLETALPAAPMAYAQTPDGRLWLASNGAGLFEMLHDGPITDPSNVRFAALNDKQGLLSGQLKAMQLDKAGNIWLSTDRGISVFLPDRGTFRNFGSRHGTLKRDYINAAATQLTDGIIAFGGMDGFTLFQPDHVLTYQPDIVAMPHITAIKVNGNALQNRDGSTEAALASVLYDTGKLTVPAKGERNFSFEFSSREFIESQQVRFQYRLDPLNQDWITEDANKRIASFERLPPGNYVFRVRAGLPQANWSEEKQLAVTVLPLWWETWPARLALLALFFSVMVAAHLFRLSQMKKRQEELAWLVAERTEALNDKTQALQESKNKAEQTLEQLASTMKELVRTEKMAALGQLVAGVAHEVNTPLGVALTASSLVSEESQLLQKKLAEGNIRRQELDAFLQKLTQATRLLDGNLLRAAQLVTNFKQVSVDRTADNQRKFNLAVYLDELLESLSLMWKSRQIVIDVNCPDQIIMDSYPGTIGQIITNFTQNAVVHAFKDRESGQINITCISRGDKVEISFSDDGAGISSDYLEQIFDPFFTTSRHQGGTGLGLHIVFNLITQKLRGSISVTSTPGKGTRFILLLPLEI